MDTERELLKGNTPTLVLAILARGPQHTYAIGRIIKERTDAVVDFKRGTLYPVLHALERDGLVAGAWDTEEAERPRRIYQITDAGRAELERRTTTWNRFAKAIDTILEGGGTREQPA